MATYVQNLSNQRDAMLAPYAGDQKFSSYSEPPLCSGNISLDSNQHHYLGPYSDILSQGLPPPIDTRIGFQAFVDQEKSEASDQDGLSLSLGSQLVHSSISDPSFSFLNSHPPILEICPVGCEADEGKHTTFKTEALSHRTTSDLYQLYNVPGFSSNTMFSSKYLKAAQQLLDEVVNVQEALKEFKFNKKNNFNETDPDGGSNNRDLKANLSTELSPLERRDLKNRSNKLLSMLNEVDRRYKLYCHQMKTMVSSFNTVMGIGAAESYMELALQTISSHFRRLRDAISEQILVNRRILEEQDSSLSGQDIIPSLRYVDQQLRQQTYFQHLGLSPHSWRPQRGLPQTSVSILRAWLFEHFLHPYPKDSEKIMLARETGLTKNQVANWFINARVRLWKPMVEEMHKKEFGDSLIDLKSSPENPQKDDNNAQDIKQSGRNCDDNFPGDVTTCDISKLGYFCVGNDVSLSLELRRFEKEEYSVSGGAQTVSSNAEDASSVGLESMATCRFGTSLLQDFVI